MKKVFRLNIILLYFAFTSLSTVGFGDYNPKSDFERFIIAFSLFIGVNIFSMILGNFLAMLESHDKFH